MKIVLKTSYSCFFQSQSPQALRAVDSFVLPVVSYPRFQSFLLLGGGGIVGKFLKVCQHH